MASNKKFTCPENTKDIMLFRYNLHCSIQSPYIDSQNGILVLIIKILNWVNMERLNITIQIYVEYIS